MGIEIEKKFLVSNDSWRDAAEKQLKIRQGYLNSVEKSSVRVRIEDDRANINIKGAVIGSSRLEYEYPIPVDDAEEMLDQLAVGPQISKIRHHVRVGEHLWEVDEFFGDNAGLIVAEIELGHEDESFVLPDWVGDEVTSEAKYYNAMLVKQPYSSW